MRDRRAAALATLGTLVLVMAACSSSGSSQAPSSEAPSSQAPSGNSVTLSGSAFSVDEITIPVGSLTFINDDGVTHIVAEGENGTEVAAPRVEKVSLGGGAQGDLVFSAAGDYHITCLIHSQMNMVVHVQ